MSVRSREDYHINRQELDALKRIVEQIPEGVWKLFVTGTHARRIRNWNIRFRDSGIAEHIVQNLFDILQEKGRESFVWNVRRATFDDSTSSGDTTITANMDPLNVPLQLPAEDRMDVDEIKEGLPLPPRSVVSALSNISQGQVNRRADAIREAAANAAARAGARAANAEALAVNQIVAANNGPKPYDWKKKCLWLLKRNRENEWTRVNRADAVIKSKRRMFGRSFRRPFRRVFFQRRYRRFGRSRFLRRRRFY